MKGDVVTVLMIIGGIIILLSVLVIGVYVYQSVRWGPCWANFGQEMGEIEKTFNKLKTQESAEVTVTMGDCVGMLVFTDKNGIEGVDTSEYRNVMKCPDKEGFIIGLPYFKETESGWRFWLWHKDLAENAVKMWEEMGRGIGPLCKGLEMSISEKEIKGPEQGKTITICLRFIKKTDVSYGVSYTEGACD